MKIFNMITNFNSYLLLEKNLFQTLELPKFFIKEVYKDFKITNDFKYEKIDLDNIFKKSEYDLKTTFITLLKQNCAILGFDNDLSILWYCEIYGNEIRCLYFEGEYEFGEVDLKNYNISRLTNIDFLLKLKSDNYYTINYDRKNRADYTEKYYKLKMEFYDEFLTIYTPIFKKILLKYYEISKNELKKFLDNNTGYHPNSNEDKYFDELQRDVNKLSHLITLNEEDLSHYKYLDPIIKLLTNKTTELTNKDRYECILKNKYTLMSINKEYTFRYMTEQLSLIKYNKIDNELQKDSSKYKRLASSIFKRELKDKYKHLEDSKNFDLI